MEALKKETQYNWLAVAYELQGGIQLIMALHMSILVHGFQMKFFHPEKPLC